MKIRTGRVGRKTEDSISRFSSEKAGYRKEQVKSTETSIKVYNQ